MLNQSLVEAKIVPVYDLEGEHSEFILAISLPTKLIFIYSTDSIKRVNNRKRTIRRTLRWLRKGENTIKEYSLYNISKYPIVYLTEDDLTKILGTERKELINEIVEYANNRKS